MDNMATGFAYGMAGEDFGHMDFHSAMPGGGDGAPPPPLMPSMSHYPHFNPAMTREAMFSQANMMPSRSAMDLPRFPMVPYGSAVTDAGSPGNYNALIPPRPSYTSGAMTGFGDMFPQQLPPESDGRGGREPISGMTDSMTEHMASFGGVMSPPSSSSPSMMPSSMPVFPNNPPSIMHTAMAAAAEMSRKHEDSERGGQRVGSMQSPSHNSSHGYKSPIQSPPPSMQTCFPGQVPPPVTPQQQQHQQQQQSGSQQMPSPAISQSSRNRSPSGRYKEERDFSGGPTDPIPPLIIGNEVTPMQRRRQSPRRATMANQEMAAAAAAALAIETKQAPMPPMLSSRESHLLSAIPHSMGYPPSMAPPVPAYTPPQASLHAEFTHTSSRRGRRSRVTSQEVGGLYQVQYDESGELASGLPRKHAVVPFFKAGRFSIQEPEMFGGYTRRMPLVTQGSQTGQDQRNDILFHPNKPHHPKDSKYLHVDPGDGKGGFPLTGSSYTQSFRYKPVKRVSTEETFSRGFVEGDGYAKRGNSKTVVSPSFGEAAARAVMTTSVGDNATVVTVAIMSRGAAGLRQPRLTNSMVSPRASTSHEPTDDLKENIKTMADIGLPTLEGGSPPSGVQTRRGRRSASSAGNTMPATSSRGRTLRRRTNPDNISIEDDANFEMMMEERKEKAREAEQERMEISIRIDDTQCISYGDQKRWQCELCDKSYTTKHNLVMHMLDHNGIKPHLCLVCGKYFKQLSHLNTHMLTHDKVRPHVCDTCGKGFTQISHLKRHQAVHQDTKPYSCDECGRGFTFPSELRIHKERHISGRSVDNTCTECGEEFASAALLKQHEVVHENRQDLSCTYCNRTFRYPSQLRDHIVIHSNSRPYMCTECGMDFMKEHHLRSHQFTHTGLRPYSCTICGRAFNQRANMLRHMLIHKAERSYKCDYCEKSFTQPQTLKAHMVVHADHKPYQCNLCGKEFGRLHNLHGHMHMHNNSKPYVCFCGSSFTLKGNLNRHKKVKHGLNESTENMEEDAVHFLSSWSERARGDRSGEDTMDGYDMNGGEGQMDYNVDPHDIDGSSMDNLDKSSSRKQRKSTPRKIPRRASSARKRQAENGEGEEEQDDDEEGEEEMDDEEARSENQFPLHFQALTDENDVRDEGSVRTDMREEEETHRVKGEERTMDTPKRSCRDRMPNFNTIQNGDFVAGLSDSEKDEGDHEMVDDDAEWLPGEATHKNGKGAKLDSLIAEKFKSS